MKKPRIPIDIIGLAVLVLLAAIAAPTSAATISDADRASVADTRTYLARLEKLGFAGVVLVARGESPALRRRLWPGRP